MQRARMREKGNRLPSFLTPSKRTTGKLLSTITLPGPQVVSGAIPAAAQSDIPKASYVFGPPAEEI